MRSRFLSHAAFAGVAALLLSPAALAERIDLEIFENADAADVSGLDLWLDVLPAGDDQVDFVFHNDSMTSSIITAVYFDASAFATLALANPQILDQGPGVLFSPGATPPRPAGSVQEHGGSWTSLFSADANPPGPANGLNAGAGETLTVRFDLAGGTTVDDVVAAITSVPASFRIAQHIQALPGDASVWSITVPSPGPLALMAVGVLVAVRRRR